MHECTESTASQSHTDWGANGVGLTLLIEAIPDALRSQVTPEIML
jgi:hypothetical protein